MIAQRVGVLMLAISLAVAAGPVSARTWHVPAEIPTIAAAIDSATSGDVVEISGGTYNEQGLILKHGLTIRSEDLLNPATIEADGAGRIFSGVSVDSLTLTGLTMTGGYASNGGAMALQSCRNVVVRSCNFVANRASIAIGGALQVDTGSSIVIEDCRFEGNDCQLDDGGAIWLSTGEAEITHCTFVSNHAINGGAISCSGPGAQISQCVFEANDAFNGGAIDFRANTTVVTDCLFVGNTATRGGAIGCWYESTPEFIGCTLVENEASDEGGGIYCTSSAVATIERSIIAFNSGDAVACQLQSSATLSCSDVHGNSGGDWTGCLEGQEVLDGNFDLDPVFCPDSSEPNWQLDSTSPCLPENNPCGLLVGAFPQGCSISAVPMVSSTVPLHLLGNHPNPFNPSTIISFTLDQSASVDLRVYDLAGKLVRVLARIEPRPIGRHGFRWDGRDQQGRLLAAGIYPYRLVSGPYEAVGAAVLLK